MTKKLFAILWWTLLSTLIVVGQNFPAKPNPPRLVNDFAQVLSPQENNALEQKLVAYNDTTSNEIAIVTIASLQGYEVGDYAVRLGEYWGIGRAAKNNGLLILVAVEDRKVNISTGYGLEGVIPDISASRIIREQIGPNFKQGNYYAGLDAATTRIIELAAGEYKNDEPIQVNGSAFLLAFIIIFGIIGLILYIKVLQVRRYARLNNVSFWNAWNIINALEERKRGRWRGFHSSGSPWIGGGGGNWGGGGSSGGFGGFGGGSFGGGGASGGW